MRCSNLKRLIQKLQLGRRLRQIYAKRVVPSIAILDMAVYLLTIMVRNHIMEVGDLEQALKFNKKILKRCHEQVRKCLFCVTPFEFVHSRGWVLKVIM